MRRLEYKPLPGPTGREMDWPKIGEVMTLIGVPTLTLLKIFRAETASVRL